MAAFWYSAYGGAVNGLDTNGIAEEEAGQVLDDL
jgi:hypothetical protein